MSWCTASRTTVRETPCAAASRSSVGSRSPGRSDPASIWLPRRAASRSESRSVTSGRGSGGVSERETAPVRVSMVVGSSYESGPCGLYRFALMAAGEGPADTLPNRAIAHRHEQMASVTIQGVRKSFGETAVLHGVDIDIADGSFTVLVGPSGCGKSTLLRMIAGLEEISGGEIRIGDKRVNDVPPKERDIAMVFQNYALYPHMTVPPTSAYR